MKGSRCEMPQAKDLKCGRPSTSRTASLACGSVLLGLVSLLCVACSDSERRDEPPPATDQLIPTFEANGSIDALDNSQESVHASAILMVDGADGTDYDPGDGEMLRVSVGSETAELVRASGFSDRPLGAGVKLGSSDRTVTFELLRQNEERLVSSVELPTRIDLAIGETAWFGDPIPLTWRPGNSGSLFLAISGNSGCSIYFPEVAIEDDGEHTIVRSDFEYLGRSDDTVSCQLLIKLTRLNNGTVDRHFAPGGTITGRYEDTESVPYPL